jgi:hypothetical protein
VEGYADRFSSKARQDRGADNMATSKRVKMEFMALFLWIGICADSKDEANNPKASAIIVNAFMIGVF